jgi:hypothetical protein
MGIGMSVGNRTISFFAKAGGWVMSWMLAAAIAGCGGEAEQTPPPPTGFAFFDVGAETALTDSVRRHLDDQLGSGAVTGRGIVDLEINYPGFLRDHFPEIDRLNRVLNHPPMERVEHDITRLMYRYARLENKPFHYVELVFSNHSGKPLFIKVNAKRDGPAIVDQLKQKYGEPETVDWLQSEGDTLYWRKNGDVLTMSVAPNRIGELEYRIAIYYVGTLEEMIELEKKEAEAREEALERAGKKAF